MTDEFNRLANNAIHALDELFDHLHAVQADDGEDQRERQGQFEYYANRVQNERDRMAKIKAQIEEI